MIVPEVARILKEGPTGGVFFLFGDDEFRKEAAAAALRDLHLDPATADFNLDRLRGSEVDGETLASVLATPPMMAEWRVVMIQEAQAFAGQPRVRQALLGVAEAPPPGLALILQATIPSGSKAKFYSQLRKAATSLEFRGLSEDDAPGWLMEYAREELRRELDPDAARAIVTALGADLGVLAAELTKLASVADDDEPISLDVARRAGTYVPRADRWQWFELVGGRRFSTALDQLPILLSQGESGVGLTIGLATHLLRIGTAAQGGTPALEAALPPHQRWLARKIAGQARGWTAESLGEALLGLERVDRLLKSSPLNDEHLLGSWLLELQVREEVAA